MSRPAAEALLQRARDLCPALVARVPETRASRRLPAETVAELQGAGLFDMLKPARYGGYEHDPGAFFRVQMEIARACPSTAWVLGVVSVHAWQLALFDDRAQREVWGADPRALVSSSYMPVGEVTRVDGGFRLSGHWSFSSGCDHCRWIFLGAFCPVEGGPPDMRTFLVPRAEYEIVDNWEVSGLQGTGSKDILVDDVFVPEHRTHKFSDGFRCASPGNEVNTAPLYRVPFGQIFVRSVSTSAIGMAQGALDAYLGITATRVGQSDGAKVADDAVSQVVVARADYALRECRLILEHNMRALMVAARAGEQVSLPDRVRFRFDSSMAAERCAEAIDALFTSSGGRAIFEENPMQRFFQDIHAARAHFANNPEKPGRNLGRVLLGMRTTDYFL